MATSALPKIVRNKYEIFWYIHKCYYGIFIFTFIHGWAYLIAEPVYWKFIIGPAAIFVIEIIICARRYFYYKMKIISVKIT